MSRATFFGLEIGRTGMAVSQVGLDVTGHNIANVDTLGYTRQRIVQTAYDPNPLRGKIKPMQHALVGGGTLVRVHDQIRSAFLDRQFRTEQALYSYWETRTQGLTFVQSVFEDSDANFSLNDTIRKLFDSFQIGTTNTDDVDPRSVIRENAITTIQQFNIMYDELITLQKGQDQSYVALVNDINTKAENIAALNDSIYRFELLSNEYANDLRDKRNLLLDQLSEIADISYEYASDGRLSVTLAGHTLLDHLEVNKLSVRLEDNVLEGEDPVHVAFWDDTTEDLNFDELDGGLKAGKLKAAKDLRDGIEAKKPGIPNFIDQLNNLVRAIVQEVNNQHNAGWTYPEPNAVPARDSVTNVDFFDASGGIDSITAKNISLSQDIIDSVKNIAMSSEEVIIDPSDPTKMIEGNNENMKAIQNLINSKEIVLDLAGPPARTITIGSFEGFLTSIGESVFTTLSTSKKNHENRQVQIIDVENQRQAISGVSLDEEMTNMMKYTHAFNGAARVITAMDEAIDVIVNRMGRVGL